MTLKDLKFGDYYFCIWAYQPKQLLYLNRVQLGDNFHHTSVDEKGKIYGYTGEQDFQLMVPCKCACHRIPSCLHMVPCCGLYSQYPNRYPPMNNSTPICRVLAGELLRGSDESAGFDLFARGDHTINPGDQLRIPVTLVTNMDSGWVGLIQDKSGMADKRVYINGGVIDADYPKEWEVMLENRGREPFVIPNNTRFAQVIFVQFGLPDKYSTKNGQRVGGFGSTGVS